MASDGIRRLRLAFARGDLLPPSKDEPNLVDVFRDIASWAGALPVSDGRADPRYRSLADPFAHYPYRPFVEGLSGLEGLLLVIVDGLGTSSMRGLPERSFLRSSRQLEIRSLFPASTTAVLTSFATASWPAEHAALAWWMHLDEPKLDLVSLPFKERASRRPLEQLGVPVESVFPRPSVWPGCSRMTVILPQPIVGSVYSRYCFGDHPQLAYGSLAEAFNGTRQLLDGVAGKQLVYLYLPQYDDSVHRSGERSSRSLDLLSQIDSGLQDLAANLPSGYGMVVTADHGMLDLAEGDWLQLTKDDALLADLRCAPSGEPRFPIFHLVSGRGESFRAAFSNRFGEHFVLLTPAEAQSLELFGPAELSTDAGLRLGDFFGVALGKKGFFVRESESSGPPMIGVHGGLSHEEMTVPLILAGTPWGVGAYLAKRVELVPDK